MKSMFWKKNVTLICRYLFAYLFFILFAFPLNLRDHRKKQKRKIPFAEIVSAT
jgi:hypothetical protein